jgi:hypothetical protein
MFQVFLSSDKHGRESFDLEDLPLPSGVHAHTLTREQLYTELLKLGVDEIAPQSGKQELLVAFARHERGTG